MVSYAAVKEVGGLKVERALLFYNGCLFVLDATAVFWHDGRQEHVWMFFDVWPMLTRVLFFDVFFDAFLMRLANNSMTTAEQVRGWWHEVVESSGVEFTAFEALFWLPYKSRMSVDYER